MNNLEIDWSLCSALMESFVINWAQSTDKLMTIIVLTTRLNDQSQNTSGRATLNEQHSYRKYHASHSWLYKWLREETWDHGLQQHEGRSFYGTSGRKIWQELTVQTDCKSCQHKTRMLVPTGCVKELLLCNASQLRGSYQGGAQEIKSHKTVKDERLS